MNWIGGGLIVILDYTTNGSVIGQTPILTESGDEILAENSDFLEVETS